MADTTPSNYIIGIILFSIVVVGGISIIGNFRDVDSTFIDSSEYASLTSTFDKTSELKGNISSLENTIETGGKEEYGTLGVIGGLIDSAWSSLRLLGSSFGFMNDVFNGLSMFGIPIWILSLITLIISVIIVFSLYSLIFQGRT